MGKAPAFQFYVKDWLSDSQLKMASHSTKGIWIDQISHMWDAPKRGQLSGTRAQLQRMVGATDEDFERFLEEAEALSFCDIFVMDNGIITIRNRRMWREEKERDNNRIRQQRHRAKRKGNAEVTPSSSFAFALSSKDDLSKVPFDHCPHQAIVALYHKHLPMCSEIVKWTDNRARNLRARWNEDREHQNLEWWDAFFAEIAKSKFLTGRVTGRSGRAFFASLDWIVKPENFTKILEGRYHEQHDN